MKSFLEWMVSEDFQGDVESFKRICRDFHLIWKIEGGDLLVGSPIRPGAYDVGMDVARQATLALNSVPGGQIEPVERDGVGRVRFSDGVSKGQLFVRKIGVDPGFLELL